MIKKIEIFSGFDYTTKYFNATMAMMQWGCAHGQHSIYIIA